MLPTLPTPDNVHPRQSKRDFDAATADSDGSDHARSAPSSPPAPALARQWSASADPLVRILSATKASKALAKYGRRVMQRVLRDSEAGAGGAAATAPAVPVGTITLTGSVKGVSVPVTTATTFDELYTAVAVHLPPAAGFKLVAAKKCVAVACVCVPCRVHSPSVWCWSVPHATALFCLSGAFFT